MTDPTLRAGGSHVTGAAAAQLAALLTGPVEPLDEELSAHLVAGPLGPAIKHPLVVAPVYGPQLNALYNEQLRHKRIAVEAAAAAGDVAQVVWLHERPWRAETFAAHAHLLDDASYWALLARVWIDSENIVEMSGLRDRLLRADRPERDALMSPEEQAAVAGLPEVVEIFQGHTDARDDGWSWTVQRPVAEWFAHRFATFERATPLVSTARVPRAHVVAYFLSRGEAEVLVPPECVKERTTGPVRSYAS